MLRSLKFLLIWLLALALPLQGWAAAGMIDCGTDHHQMTSAMMQPVNNAMSMQHMQSAPDAHQTVTDATLTSSNKQPEKPGNKHSNAKCSICTAFCLSAAITPPAVPEIVFPLLLALTLSSTLDVHFTAHFPDGLERPPHAFFS